MRLRNLICSEILRHKKNFAAGVLAIAVATGALTAAVCSLQAHDSKTTTILQQEAKETQKEMSQMAEDIEEAMETLGFNMIILPEEQETANWHSESYAEKTMPEEYARRLSNASLPAIGNILAVLRKKIEWPETNWSIILAGKGAVNETSPIKSGQAQLGYEICRGLKLKPGDTIQIKGKDFKVTACLRAEGNKDDVTIWMNLNDAQAITGNAGLINEIHIKEYRGQWQALADARSSILEILPDTKIIEKNFAASAKIMAFEKAKERRLAALESDRRHSAAARARLKKFSTLITSGAMLICIVWIATLASQNINERLNELAVLRSVGVGARQIITLFTGRLLILSLTGAVTGYLGGSLAASGSWPARPPVLILAISTSVFLTFISAYLPVLKAVKRDPASIFQEAQ